MYIVKLLRAYFKLIAEKPKNTIGKSVLLQRSIAYINTKVFQIPFSSLWTKDRDK